MGTVKRVAGIDALRGVAALSVVVGHTIQQFYAPALGIQWAAILSWLGSFGVAIFFVVSGFCIHLPHAKKNANGAVRLDRSAYILSRAFRIGPPYYVAIALSLLAGSYIASQNLSEPIHQYDITLHLLGIHTLLPGSATSINAVLWTIGLEIQFYGLYLVFADRPFTLRATSALLAVSLVTYGAFALLPRENPWREVGLISAPVYLWQWFLGALLATWAVSGRARILGVSYLTAAAVLATVGLAFVDPTLFGAHLRLWILPILCAVIVWWGATYDGNGRAKLVSVLAAIGMISYSIYLFHLIAIGAVSAAMTRFGAATPLWPLLAVPLSVALGLLGYRLVERPAISARRKFVSALRSAVGSTLVV